MELFGRHETVIKEGNKGKYRRKRGKKHEREVACRHGIKNKGRTKERGKT